MGEDTLFYVWLIFPVLAGFYARTNTARVLTPKLVKWIYIYCLCHGTIFLFLSLAFFVWMINGVYQFSELFVGWIFMILSTAFAFYWSAFETYIPGQPDFVPVGVRILASLSKTPTAQDREGFADTKTVGDRIADARNSVAGTLKAKVQTHRAKLDAYELAIAKEHEDAQADLARKTREFNEAKIRAEEAAKRKDGYER